jgi:uncharacterized protein YgfB (UPF0149 family)
VSSNEGMGYKRKKERTVEDVTKQTNQLLALYGLQLALYLPEEIKT